MLKTLSMLVLVLANSIPIIGVFLWDWDSFSLIYLYWFENVIIGAFFVMRMVIRPYDHPIELVMPLFIAPFFLVHYGMFTAGHGLFVISLFSDGRYDANMSDYASFLAPLWSEPHIMLAAAMLFAYQAVDWFMQTARHGLGTDGIKDLMVAPYRRIIVLHLTILAGGFALVALDEPTAGLVLLIIIKTGFDVYHWRKDQLSKADEFEGDFDLETEIARAAAEYPEPKVRVNGHEKQFESFEVMSRSREWRMMMAILRFMGLKKEIRIMRTYIQRRIDQENPVRPG